MATSKRCAASLSSSEGIRAITTVTSREFIEDPSRAKKAAENGPVFITDRGRPSHVLLSIGEYRQLVGSQAKIADLLSHPDSADVELAIVGRH